MNDTDRFERQRELVPHEKLKDLTVTIIGIGAIGRQVAIQLTSLGVRKIQLMDHDFVELQNITTQAYFRDDLGRLKVDATAELLQRIDHTIQIETISDRYRPAYKTGEAIFSCVDSISSRAAIWKSVQATCSFWCDGRMLSEVMRVLTAIDENSRTHYATTLFPQTEAQVGACTNRSTIFCASVVSGLMIHQFTRWLRCLPVDLDVLFNLLATEIITQNVQ